MKHLSTGIIALILLLVLTGTVSVAEISDTASATVAAPITPVAQFTATPRSGFQPLSVTFTDMSTNTPTSWNWEYKKTGSDSWIQFSTAQNPSFMFLKHGTYSIQETATNAAGSNSLIKLDYITVGIPLPPVPDFTASPVIGVAPLGVQFTDQSTNNPEFWIWEYQRVGSRGWSLFSTVQNPYYTFARPDVYTIQLTAGNIGGVTKSVWYNCITVNTPPPPDAAFIASPRSGPGPLTVQFTDQSTNTPTWWKWEYQKPGSTRWTWFSSDQNPSVKLTTAGKYSFQLTTTNDWGSDTVTKNKYISVA